MVIVFICMISGFEAVIIYIILFGNPRLNNYTCPIIYSTYLIVVPGTILIAPVRHNNDFSVLPSTKDSLYVVVITWAHCRQNLNDVIFAELARAAGRWLLSCKVCTVQYIQYVLLHTMYSYIVVRYSLLDKYLTGINK